MSSGKATTGEQQVSTTEFSDAVLQCALAQLSKSVNLPDDDRHEHRFAKCEHGVLAVFSDIVGKYIETVGMSAAENSAVSGRSVTNLYDVINAFSTTGSPPVTVEDLYDFAASEESDEYFDRRIPDFPARKKVRMSKFGDMAENRNNTTPSSVLPFLPPYPPKHTYAHTSIDSISRVAGGLKADEIRAKQHADLRDSIAFLGKDQVYEKKMEEVANPFIRDTFNNDSNGESAESGTIRAAAPDLL
jgi:hypothetical protein|eukprot:Stramenopile-MAST_4_protein_4323